MHVETNITIVDKLWMEDGVKDMEMWNDKHDGETNITIVDKLWMEDGVKDMEMWNACRNQHNYS